MKKTQVITLISIMFILMLAAGFLSWKSSFVVKESPKNDDRTSVIPNISSFIAGFLIIGVIAIWIVIVMKQS